MYEVSGPPTVDATDNEIVERRAAAYDQISGPRVGDFIEYRDGRTRRISHLWAADWHDDNIARAQTTDGGSFYLGGAGPRDWMLPREDSGSANAGAYVSYSGALYPGLSCDHLTLRGSRNGSVWVFHHDEARAHNGVNATIAFRVYVADVDGADPWRDDEK